VGKFVLGLVVGLAAVGLLTYFYFATGRAPAATSDAPMPFEKMLAKKALHARIEKEMPKEAPFKPDELAYVAGAQIYVENCAVCHGLPGQPATAIAKGEYPAPPVLMEGKGVTDDEPGETYWKVANGIRLTGMPGFSRSLAPAQMWQVSLLLADADKLPPSAKGILAAGRR
jgi:thiosulfate dehydrogenase